MATFTTDANQVNAPIESQGAVSNNYSWDDNRNFDIQGSNVSAPIVAEPGRAPWDGAQSFFRTLQYHDQSKPVNAPIDGTSTVTPYTWKNIREQVAIVIQNPPVRYILTGFVVATRQNVNWISTNQFSNPPGGETVINRRVLGIAKD